MADIISNCTIIYSDASRIHVKQEGLIENCFFIHDQLYNHSNDNPIYSALKELVRLKELKETEGKTEEYEACISKAWFDAKQIINKVVVCTNPEPRVFNDSNISDLTGLNIPPMPIEIQDNTSDNK